MKSNLVIPIYVDTNALLDLLASIEGGFAKVEKITTQSTSNKNASIEGKLDTGTEFGIPNILNLLRVSIGGTGKVESEKSDASTQEVERYHTYGSLFFKLRSYLNEQKLLKHIDSDSDWSSLQPSDFVEIHGLIQSNPLAENLQNLSKLIDIISVMASVDHATTNKQQGKSHASQNNRQQKTLTPSSMQKIIDDLLSKLQNENIRLFIASSTSEIEFRAVIALFIEYLRDKTMLEINNKEYHILGKVVRKIDKTDTSNSINLLAGTGFSNLEDEILQPLLAGLSNIPNFKASSLVAKVTGPALEIVPIAIFV